jgi:cysteine desulfurase family protein (TIGR01976 family)
MTPFPIDYVRRQFPALAGEWTFFDNAGGSQILGRVVDRISDYLRTSNVQLGASYAVSRAATARVAAAAEGVAAMMNAADAREVVLGASTTQLLQNLAYAMAPGLAAGDEIVVTNVDHESNIGPWRRLEERGVVVKEWKVDPVTLALDVARLEPLMTARTRLVCFTHCSNVVGSIHPVAEITRFVHARGAEVCVDGVAYAPHRAIDVRAWDVDYYVFSLYKVYGPHVAALYGKRARLEALTGINHFFIGPSEVPYKLQPGNVCFELVHGAGGIGDYLDELAREAGVPPFEAIAAHEEALASRLLGFLGAHPRVKILGRRDPGKEGRVPTVSFVVEGRASSSVPPFTDAARIGIRFGDFYARRLVDSLGLGPRDGVVRVSMVHYNTLAEVDRLTAVLDDALR